MELYDVVKKLIGQVGPVGETHEDNRRFENLKVMTELADSLLTEIADVARHNKDRHEHSMQKAGKHAHSFMAVSGIEDH
ncbi:hypothetical protein KAR91_15010 [Candidatus Pacearchaeota archaeon]|nr:hypothetical protein [Candidatus Pacearchaeota archaeon]